MTLRQTVYRCLQLAVEEHRRNEHLRRIGHMLSPQLMEQMRTHEVKRIAVISDDSVKKFEEERNAKDR